MPPENDYPLTKVNTLRIEHCVPGTTVASGPTSFSVIELWSSPRCRCLAWSLIVKICTCSHFYTVINHTNTTNKTNPKYAMNDER